jgi:undecaprenyl phosphate-alpha-L-ara4N flippase subunit ArnF
MRTEYGIGVAALTVSIVSSAIAQLLLKIGVSLSPVDSPGIWWILGGLIAYGVSLFAWLNVLARMPLSFAYPLVSLSYVLVYAGAVASPFLAEALTPMRAAGVVLVACGAAIVSSTRRITP